MAALERYEYHLIADRIVQRKIVRPAGKKLWRYNRQSSTLIAVIEPSSESFSVRKGPAATDQLLVDAVRYFQGLLVDPKILDIGSEVPAEFAKHLSSHVGDAIWKAISQYRSFAEEEDITAFLKGLIQSDSLKYGDWEASIKAWTYSRRPKERDLGVDIGLIIDLLRRDLRVVKALWFQAKKSERRPVSILDLPDLSEQIIKMRSYTPESYALIYTPQEIYAFRGDAPENPLAVESVVFDGVICRRGDRTPRVVALTGDSKVVVEMLVTGP